MSPLRVRRLHGAAVMRRPRLEELEHMTVCLLLLAVGVGGFCWLACLNLEISADDLLAALGYQGGL
ncbi:hypothetical protein [Gluconobacter kanchanaburiensis]|uniref:Uncharacterized protein n=1 Tax=Gluconobacter kanchanaburiensis NBRC 103587 TaxID=1307948 RepID=A0A511BBW8_9PROT|nr:hypothetical protein [Gluconobacter kanchanaburiensis]MBF0862830.1 hypothetical protein [Gluconobacter kanchanaburiensis]GBR70442.1 hypothetical protein AA103587_1873 [Gluconobacter kanchanaburiensis NBRC 103587]GEK97113.1 hypothetical protein GKA01_23100 [Gluconobacter kanchanaburiensis NBRC 103587]